jgi:hypothetical protein
MPYAFAFVDEQLVMGLSDGTVYVSADKGDTWTKVTVEGEPPQRIVAFA